MLRYGAILALSLCTASHAGLNGLTIHSRANCINNESITWHAGYIYFLRTISVHSRYRPISVPPSQILPGTSIFERIFGHQKHESKTNHRNGHGVELVESHTVDSREDLTWRSAAVHFGEAKPGDGWVVTGQHWKRDDRDRMVVIGNTSAKDCSIYNGWWGPN